jgi:hypothetical protein
MRGFTQNDHLRSLFVQVDADKNGTLDFSEFCCTGRRTQEADGAGACSEKLCRNITSDQQASFRL